MAPYRFIQALSSFALLQTATAEFTVNCAPLTIQRGDPIVYPGQISPHVHIVTGGTAFQLNQPNEVAIGAKATTCDKVLDNSNYWQPQLYHQRKDGKFELVHMQGNVSVVEHPFQPTEDRQDGANISQAAYYLPRTCDYEPGRQNCNDAAGPIAPPAGLRMATGDPFREDLDERNFEHRAIHHKCLTATSSNDSYELPREKCLRMRAETFFPSCWDGKNLDSSNHKSHVCDFFEPMVCALIADEDDRSLSPPSATTTLACAPSRTP
jgi:hypothetical protein